MFRAAAEIACATQHLSLAEIRFLCERSSSSRKVQRRVPDAIVDLPIFEREGAGRIRRGPGRDSVLRAERNTSANRQPQTTGCDDACSGSAGTALPGHRVFHLLTRFAAFTANLYRHQQVRFVSFEWRVRLLALSIHYKLPANRKTGQKPALHLLCARLCYCPLQGR